MMFQVEFNCTGNRSGIIAGICKGRGHVVALPLGEFRKADCAPAFNFLLFLDLFRREGCKKLRFFSAALAVASSFVTQYILRGMNLVPRSTLQHPRSGRSRIFGSQFAPVRCVSRVIKEY